MIFDKISDYIQKNTDIYHNILEFIDSGTDDEKDYQKIFQSLETKNKDELRLFILLISKISENHFRFPYFFKKIESLILHFEDQIKIIFNDEEIYTMFKNSPRILLFLIQKGICTTECIYYSKLYFYPEIKNDIAKEEKENLENQFQKIDPIEVFESKRLIGENDSEICKLIREDSVVEFITYVSTNSINVSSKIPHSIYETNSFLLNHEATSLIEYAAFFGSIEIFKYLRINGATITSILWSYAIHGKNADLIHLLEGDEIKRDNKETFCESIKCHHNEIAHYFETNEEDSDHNEPENYDFNEIEEVNWPFEIANYNFDFIDANFISNKSAFYYLCKYQYFLLARLYLKSVDIDTSFLIQVDNYKYCGVKSDFEVVKKTGTEDKYLMMYAETYPNEKNLIDELKIKMKIKYPCLMELIGYSPINLDHSAVPTFWYKYYGNKTLEEYLKDKNFDTKNPKNYILILGIAIAMLYLEQNDIDNYQFFPSKILIDENFYPVVSLHIAGLENINLYSIDDIAHMPPERFADLSFFCNESNIYSFGIMLYQFFTGRKPYNEQLFKSCYKMIEHVMKGMKPDLSIIKNEVFYDLLSNCMKEEIFERICFEDIVDFITNEEFYSYYEDLDHESVKQFLDIFGDDFDHLKNKF